MATLKQGVEAVVEHGNFTEGSENSPPRLYIWLDTHISLVTGWFNEIKGEIEGEIRFSRARCEYALWAGGIFFLCLPDTCYRY